MSRRQDAKGPQGSGRGIPTRLRGVRAAIAGVLGVVRQVVGAPDYQRYLAHHAHGHGGAAPLGPREFYAEFVSRRFAPGPTRCC